MLVAGLARLPLAAAKNLLRRIEFAPSHHKNVDGVPSLVVLLAMRLVRNQFPHFRNRNRRQSAHKQEDQHDEQAQRSDKRAVIPERGG